MCKWVKIKQDNKKTVYKKECKVLHDKVIFFSGNPNNFKMCPFCGDKVSLNN